MATKLTKREYQTPDGIRWNVVVQLPSHSSAMLVYQHPDGQSSKLDRYAWINSMQVMDPRERLSAKDVMERLTDDDIARGNGVPRDAPAQHFRHDAAQVSKASVRG